MLTLTPAPLTSIVILTRELSGRINAGENAAAEEAPI